jgi:basic amino acid/polyamine antiporter, APA family
MPAPKQLNLFDATMLVMGGVIGIGIFFNPQHIAQDVPSLGPFLTMWVLGAVVAVAGAMTFAELAATFPRTGGWFVFMREAFGRLPAFLFAWVVLFVVSTGATAIIAGFASSQAAVLLSLEESAGFKAAFGASVIVVITAIALCGLKSAAIFQNLCMILKLLAIGAIVFAGVALVQSPVEPSATLATGTPWKGMLRSSLPVLFAYGGWQFITYIAPAVKDPQRTLPRAIMFGVIAIATVYLCINFAYARVLGMDGLANTPDFVAEVADRVFGPSGKIVIVAAMMVSAIGVCTAILITTPGIYVAMAREGLFFRVFGEPNARTGAPVAALLLQASVALGYFAYSCFNHDNVGNLVDSVVFTEWIFHCLCGLALLSLRKHRPELPRPFVSWGYPFFPILYAALAAVIMIAAIYTKWESARYGLLVLGAGALIYVPWRKFFAVKA